MTDPRPLARRSPGRRALRGAALAAVFLAVRSSADDPPQTLTCGNLVYAGEKRSKCFSDEFLRRLREETHLRTAKTFTEVRLESPELFHHPFVILTGEGGFQLSEAERRSLRRYLERGGFLLASAGCSSKPWDGAFRREIQRVLPEQALETIPRSHPVFSTVYVIDGLQLKRGGEGQLEGIELGGRLAVVYSPEGLNDTRNTKGCCCCGGNEVRQSGYMNANLYAYALLR